MGAASSLLSGGENGFAHYRIMEKLGEGGYGVGFKIERKSDKKTFAMKVTLCESEEDRQLAIKEFLVVKKLQGHPNMIKLIDLFMHWEDEYTTFDAKRDPVGGTSTRRAMTETSGSGTAMRPINDDHTALLVLQGKHRFVCIVMEYFGAGDLKKYVLQSFDPVIPESKVVKICRQVASVLHYLHNQKRPVVHRDIKPENILLDSASDRVVVSDFGLAVEMKKEFLTKRCGSMYYMSPETFTGKTTPKSDIWSLGCVLYSVCTKKVTVGNAVVMFQFAKQSEFTETVDHELEILGYTHPFRNLILSMLRVDPTKRPSAVEVVVSCDRITPNSNATPLLLSSMRTTTESARDSVLGVGPPSTTELNETPQVSTRGGFNLHTPPSPISTPIDHSVNQYHHPHPHRGINTNSPNAQPVLTHLGAIAADKIRKPLPKKRNSGPA